MGDRRGTVFFDYDGTLHDTMALYGPAFRAACAWLSKEGWLERRTYADADIACWLGWTTEEMWTTFAPHLPEPVWREASLRVRDEMERLRKEGRARLFPGVEEALDEVASRGATMVLLSNCWRSYGEDHMREFGLGRWIEGLHCAQDFDWIPKWQIYREVASFYPLPHIMVGDRFHDREVALRNDVPFVACAYGFGEPGECEGADAIAECAEELPRLIAQKLAAFER